LFLRVISGNEKKNKKKKRKEKKKKKKKKNQDNTSARREKHICNSRAAKSKRSMQRRIALKRKRKKSNKIWFFSLVEYLSVGQVHLSASSVCHQRFGNALVVAKVQRSVARLVLFSKKKKHQNLRDKPNLFPPTLTLTSAPHAMMRNVTMFGRSMATA
jgi:signal recognition particle GTPase